MSPESLPSHEGGDIIKRVLLGTLSKVSAVEAGFIPQEPDLVATRKGMVPLIASNTKEIRREIYMDWGKTYPDLFGEILSSGTVSLSDLVRFEQAAGYMKGTAVRTWNALGRNAAFGRPEFNGLFDETSQNINLDHLSALQQRELLLEASGFGEGSDEFIKEFREHQQHLQTALADQSE